MAHGAASLLLRCCAMTSRLNTVRVADEEQARKARCRHMSPSAWLRARRYRGPEQPEGISTSSTRRMDGYTFLLWTLCPIRRRDKDAGWSGPGIRLPDAQASRRGQPSARRKRRRDENSGNNHLAGVRLSSCAACARRCSLARMRAPRARPRLTAATATIEAAMRRLQAGPTTPAAALG